MSDIVGQVLAELQRAAKAADEELDAAETVYNDAYARRAGALQQREVLRSLLKTLHGANAAAPPDMGVEASAEAERAEEARQMHRKACGCE